MTITPSLPSGERVYAIGDVHGRADLLAELLDAIRRDNDARPDARVRVILLGDLVDRGPSSADVVARCRDLADRHDCFIVLRGNHEAMMVDSLRGSVPAFAFWLGQGGDATLASWGVPAPLVADGPSRALMTAAKESVPAELVAWLANRPLYHQCGNCLFVHAGIRPGVRLAKQKAVDLLWIRHDFTEDTTPRPYVVVHGHTIDETGPRLDHGRLGIDTGAYRTGRLTAVGIEGEDHWSLSTGSRPVEAGEVPPPEESVAAILGNGSERVVPPPRSAMPTRTLATGAAVMAALLLIGTIATVRWRDDGPAAGPPTIASAEERRPDKATADDRVPSREPAMPAEPLAMTDPERPAARIAAPSAPDRSSSPRVGRAVTPAPIRPVRGRPAPTRLAGGAPDGPVSRAPVAPSPALAPPVRLEAAAVAASAAPPPVRALLPVPVLAAETPSPKPSPEPAKERVEAIDAIRQLRRQ